MNKLIKVAVWTDGMGSYQARCMGCAWRGKWHRQEAKAKADAKQHKQHEPLREQESVADFKQRIALMKREQETGHKYSIIGASRPSECLLRPRKHERPEGWVRCADHRNGGATFCPRGGAALQMWQRQQWGDRSGGL